MTTTWTALFTADDHATGWIDLDSGLSTAEGRRLLIRLAGEMSAGGWSFGEPYDEGHGWDAEAGRSDGKTDVPVRLVIAPGEDADAPFRWRVVVGVNLGFWGSTRARRTLLLNQLARDTDAALRRIGAREVVWEHGDLSAAG